VASLKRWRSYVVNVASIGVYLVGLLGVPPDIKFKIKVPYQRLPVPYDPSNSQFSLSDARVRK
jgi:hypothetical protein